MVSLWCLTRYSEAATRKPAVPQAGSQITSFGVVAVMSTISLMMWRTPRHILQLMADMTAPTPKDVICDPACGTAGFLVAASEYLVEHYSDTIYKDATARRRFNEGTFHGYDFDSTMLRIGSMNMLLHGVENPDIRYRDSLAQADDDD